MLPSLINIFLFSLIFVANSYPNEALRISFHPGNGFGFPRPFFPEDGPAFFDEEPRTFDFQTPNNYMRPGFAMSSSERIPDLRTICSHLNSVPISGLKEFFNRVASFPCNIVDQKPQQVIFRVVAHRATPPVAMTTAESQTKTSVVELKNTFNQGNVPHKYEPRVEPELAQELKTLAEITTESLMETTVEQDQVTTESTKLEQLPAQEEKHHQRSYLVWFNKFVPQEGSAKKEDETPYKSNRQHYNWRFIAQRIITMSLIGLFIALIIRLINNHLKKGQEVQPEIILEKPAILVFSNNNPTKPIKK